MANGKYININYPFKDSPKGFFLDLNSGDQQAIKADLMHLILTRKGQRLYNPDFGTDLLKFIFEPEDGMTLNSVKEEVFSTVKKYMPQLKLDELTIEEKVEEIVASKLKSTEKEEVKEEISEASEEELEVKDVETSTIPNNSAEASNEVSLLEKLKQTFSVEVTK